ncbi:DUF502 domain-containing protein [Microbaculum marinum]|uniref:DUF502 domain-containing protein n=1 Tax=Microbaculum marinum TaxID=1764581 RepID=A0AAW9RYD4_9HYPH
MLPPERAGKRRVGLGMRLRNYFLTGLVIAAPLSITIYITWTFIGWVDAWVKPWIPHRYNPDYYLPFTIPGFGLIVAVVLLILLGATTANLFGRTVIAYGEMLLDRMPLVRSIYRGLKQIFETVLSQTSQSFQDVGLIEYPRTGLWAIVFVATETKGELKTKAGGDDDDLLSVFLPTTPNPTSGFLLFVPRKEVIILDMTVEDAAKVVISGGLVMPRLPEEDSTGTRPRAVAGPAPVRSVDEDEPKNAAE